MTVEAEGQVTGVCARPKPVTQFTPNVDGYYDHNRYFNEAENLFIELERMIPELKKNAGSYTGEYEGGQLDLIHDILGLERVEWGTDFTLVSKQKRKQQ